VRGDYASPLGRSHGSDPIRILLDEGHEDSILQPGSPEITSANIATCFYPGILVHWGRLQTLELLQFWMHRRGGRRVLRILVLWDLGNPPGVGRRARQTAKQPSKL
jgi:hypothetical protein